MTVAPLTPCKHPGCHKYAVPGTSYCEDHSAPAERLTFMQRKQNALRDRRRGTRTQRGYSNQWLAASKAFLTEHPMCAECLKNGRFTPATEVDHIIPHKGDMVLFWNRKNWQALCHKCHSTKTVREDGGFGRPVCKTKKPLKP